MDKRLGLAVLSAVLLFFIPSSLRAWQQSVAYKIDVSLNTKQHTLTGTEWLIYRNNSPDTLKEVWFHLYPNAYKDNQTAFAQETYREGSYRFFFAPQKDRGFIDIKTLQMGGVPIPPAQREIKDTEMKVLLPKSIAPGDSAVFAINFFVKVPDLFSRLGHVGRHYEISQWYPKVVVYDEKGWHPDGYHSLGEFYGEYGTYDVAIQADTELVFGGTGQEVKGETCGMDCMGCEMPEASGGSARFHAENVHDFAWVADAKYRVLEDSIDGTLIRVLYLPKHGKAWRKVPGYARDALSRFGKWYGKYPYPTLTVADGSLKAGGGMEYPNLVIISMQGSSSTRLLELAVAHEICHQWFYGMLGSNEMDQAWMDEGMTAFSEVRYFEAKYGTRGNLAGSRFFQALFPEATNRMLYHAMYYLAASNGVEEPAGMKAYAYREGLTYAAANYAKPALMFLELRREVGDSLFDKAMKAYVEKYRYQHPGSEDFFATFDREAGTDLAPLLRRWLYTTKPTGYSMLPSRTGLVPIGKPKGGIRFRPLIGLPDFDHYTVIAIPLFSISDYDGFRPEVVLWGGRFLDQGPILGQDNATLTLGWGMKSKSAYIGPSYQRRLPGPGKRTRVLFAGWFSKPREERSLTLATDWGPYLTRGPRYYLALKTDYLAQKDTVLEDPRDYTVGNVTAAGMSFAYDDRGKRFGNYVRVSARAGLASPYQFQKGSVDLSQNARVARNLKFFVRGFAGYAAGDVPAQEQFYLAGTLFPEDPTSFVLARKGWFSPQEYWHVQGDANLRGYYKRHLRGKRAASLTLETSFPPVPAYFFFDAGNVWDQGSPSSRRDAGLGLKLGPLDCAFPVWVSDPESGDKKAEFRAVFGLR
jgi:Peptidase family M1 domain